MVDKTTPRLGLPVPFLTNPLKLDVGKLTQALTMLDANAVMLTDWDITADSWQKMGTIKGLAQGKIALTLMVITGTGFANIVMQTGDGSVTTVGDPARITVTAQTNLGGNQPTILGGKIVETSLDTYEVWFNVAPSTAPRKWSGLLAAGNGATIDWTHASGAQPTGGVDLLIARSLTDQEIASPTVTREGAVMTAGYIGLGSIAQAYYDLLGKNETIFGRTWRVGEIIRITSTVAKDPKAGFPGSIPVDKAPSGWNIRCESINESRTVKTLVFTTEGDAGTAYRIRTAGAGLGTPTVLYSSNTPPTAAEVKAVAQLPAVTVPQIDNLNVRILPAHYGVCAIMSDITSLTPEYNYPYKEQGQLMVFPFGSTGGVTQIYITTSGRVAARNYDGSVFTNWRKGANAGVNDDITSMTGLSGPLKLGGDAVGDYDAVTFRQLKAASGGSGPTMNGVVNNFVGAVEWWNGSRAKIPAGYLPADGQLLKRSDYPEIWAAIANSVVNSVTEAEWQASGITNAAFRNQGVYSTGTITSGADANFRMPDMNGATTGNFGGMFLSGPARGNQSGTLTTRLKGMYSQAAPNITGDSAIRAIGTAPGNAYSPLISFGGALYDNGSFTGAAAGLAAGGSANTGYRMSLDASKSNSTYGADVSWLYPNNIVGIWLIRVSSSFQAANTNFSVIAGDTTLPGNNTSISGGSVISDYQVAGVSEGTVTLRMAGTVGSFYNARLSITNKTKNITKNFDFTDDGSLTVPGAVNAQGSGSFTGDLRVGSGSVINGLPSTGTVNTQVVQAHTVNLMENNKNFGTVVNSAWTDANASTSALRWEVYMIESAASSRRSNIITVDCSDITKGVAVGGGGTNSTMMMTVAANFRASGTVTGNGAYINSSDRRAKTNVERVPDALKAVCAWSGYSYDLRDAGREVGLMAQEVEAFCPEAITTMSREFYDGTVIEDFKGLNTAGVAAAYHTEAIKTLVNLLELALTNPKEAKAQIAALRK